MPRPSTLPLWAHVLDAITIAILIVAAFVMLQGGFVLHTAWLRVSVTSEWRLYAWAGALVLLRHLLVARPPIHRSIAARLAAAGRAPGPLPEEGEGEPSGRATPAPSKSRGRSAVIAAGVFLIYAGLTLLMTYPQIRQIDAIPTDTGDPLLSTWRLAWIAHQLPRDPLHLYDANIFYPERHTLAYSDAMLVPSLAVAPLVWLGVHQLIAYNLLLLSGFALSGLTMFLLVRYLTQHAGAAFFAGFVFAFLPFRFMHYAHLELQMAQWIPLSLLAFHKTVKEGGMRNGGLTGLCFALQALSSWYYGIFFATVLVPIAAAVLIGSGWHRARRAVAPLLAGGVLAAMLVVPCAIPYMQARQSVGERPLSEIQFYSATRGNYLAAHQRNAAYGSLLSKGGGQERELFQGIGVPLIALVGLWPPMTAARIGYAVALLLGFEVSLGYNGAVYPLLHDLVVPYRGLRVPARMAMLVGLLLAIFGGYGVARICRRIRSRPAAAAACAALFLVAVLEYRSTLRLRHVWSEPPPAYAALPAGRHVLLNLPLIAPDIALEPFYMYFSTFDWSRMVNGYSGFSPPSYAHVVELMKSFPDDASLDELRRRSVDFIIIHGAFYRLGIYNGLVAQLDRRRDLRLVGLYPWDGRENRVYQVLRDGFGASPRRLPE